MAATWQWQRQEHLILEHKAADGFVLASGLQHGEETSAVLTIQKRLTRLPDTDRNINEHLN